MNDGIKDLDAALTGESAASSLEETYPDAPQQAIENAKQLDQLKNQIEALTTKIGARQIEQELQREHINNELAAITEQVAVLATQAGVATEDEKELAKSVTQSTDSDEQTELGKLFAPSSAGGQS
jgi:phage host-nuclease inhibitor protein Gam